MKKNVITLLQKRNTTNLSLLEKACNDAVSVFNETIKKLEATTEQYKTLRSDIDNEIGELTVAKNQIDNKISDITKVTDKFKDFLK